MFLNWLQYKYESEYMLRITIEIWPYGDAKKARVLDGLCIANDGKGSVEFGNYGVMYDGQEEYTPVVSDWPRNKQAIELLYEVLKKRYGD